MKQNILLTRVVVILCGLNGFLPIFIISSFSYLPGYYPILLIWPIALVAWGLGPLPIFIVIILLLISIPLTIYKKYKYSIMFCVIGGILTIPLGILGLTAALLIDRLSSLEIEYKIKDTCPICCHPTQFVPKYKRYYCKNCGDYI
ncbi:MAG: hypothetical protein KAJ51_07140 [Thermoplasmata archaeon]|nr:hypothetical protein [Thermoplasmata archaeon]